MTRHWHIDVGELERLWCEGVPTKQIAEKFNVSKHQVYKLRKQYGIATRQIEPETNDPTPAQIAERAAAIRERHLQEMRAMR